MQGYYTVLARPQAVIAMVTTADGRLVLNEEYLPSRRLHLGLASVEYRHPVGQYVLSAPGGVVDEGETPLQAAARELREETGFQAARLRIIGSCYPLPGIWAQQASCSSLRKSASILESSLPIGTLESNPNKITLMQLPKLQVVYVRGEDAVRTHDPALEQAELLETVLMTTDAVREEAAAGGRPVCGGLLAGLWLLQGRTP
eukprot:SM000100S09405  [mRNA]  locus=s100:116298:117741:- [translate_table: standard]